jgi:hypothetical protein
VGTGFPKRSCSNKELERDDDSKKSHPAPVELPFSFFCGTEKFVVPPASGSTTWPSMVAEPALIRQASAVNPREG